MAIKFTDLSKKLREAIETSLDRSLMESIAVQGASLIRIRTRLGYGTSEERISTRQKLKSLTENYVSRRKNSKHLNRDLTGPKRSNLTFTGRMLDAIKGRGTSNTKAVIEILGSHGNNLLNKDLAAYVSAAGRPFFNLTTLEVKQLSDNLRGVVIKRVNEKLTK